MHTILNKHFIRILMNKKPLTYRMVVLQYREMVNGFGIQMVHKKIHKPDDCLAWFKDGNIPWIEAYY